MDEKVIALIQGFLGSAVIASIIAYLLQRRKAAAEASDIEAKVQLLLIAPLEKRIADQDARIAQLEAEVQKWMDRNDLLVCKIEKITEDYSTRISNLETAGRAKDATIEALTERVKRLEAQIVSMGQHPVK